MPTPLIRDPRGNVVPLGRVRRELSLNGLAGTLPSQLTAISGVATVGTLVATNGYIQLDTAAAGAAGEIQFAADISLTRYRMLAWTVEGLTFDTNDYTKLNFDFGFRAPTSGPGIRAEQKVTDGAWLSTCAASPQTLEARYQITGLNATNCKNITIMLTLGTNRRVFLMSDDQVLKSWSLAGTNFATGTARPYIRLSATDSTVHYLRFLQAKLAFEDNRPMP